MLTVEATIEVWDDDAPEWSETVTEYGSKRPQRRPRGATAKPRNDVDAG